MSPGPAGVKMETQNTTIAGVKLLVCITHNDQGRSLQLVRAPGNPPSKHNLQDYKGKR